MNDFVTLEQGAFLLWLVVAFVAGGLWILGLFTLQAWLEREAGETTDEGAADLRAGGSE